MHKWVLFSLPLLLSVSFATPLIGTKASFAESNFCRKWKCVFISSNTPVINGKIFAKDFIYTLSDGAEIDVARVISDNTIFDVIVSYHGNAYLDIKSSYSGDKKYLKDLIQSFTGEAGTFNLYSDCIATQSAAGIGNSPNYMFGGYKVGCISSSGQSTPKAGLVVSIIPK